MKGGRDEPPIMQYSPKSSTSPAKYPCVAAIFAAGLETASYSGICQSVGDELCAFRAHSFDEQKMRMGYERSWLYIRAHSSSRAVSVREGIAQNVYTSSCLNARVFPRVCVFVSDNGAHMQLPWYVRMSCCVVVWVLQTRLGMEYTQYSSSHVQQHLFLSFS